MDKEFKYTGSELEIFERAINWKDYYYELCAKFLQNNESVLEVGAGIGGLTKIYLRNRFYKKWTCIEPDKKNYKKLKKNLEIYSKKNNLEIINSSIEDYLKVSKKFDLIILADVLEHLQNDKEILFRLYKILNSKGRIILFTPACQYLYSKFDKEIGHFRRYSFETLENIIPNNSEILMLKYIDSFGFFASLTNKLIIKSATPSLKQILFWDRLIIPISKKLDYFFSYKFGKNIFMILSK